MAVASESYAPSVLVSTEGLPEKDWLEYRRRGIGGSDAAAILGISPFATARDLYYDKLKIVPFDDSESNWVCCIGQVLPCPRDFGAGGAIRVHGSGRDWLSV